MYPAPSTSGQDVLGTMLARVIMIYILTYVYTYECVYPMYIHTNVCIQLLARLGKTLPEAMLARVIMLPALSHEVLSLLALLV